MTQPRKKEKWSAKYKKSINCSIPKGFSKSLLPAGPKNVMRITKDPSFPINP